MNQKSVSAQLFALAVLSSAERNPLLPDIATFAELAFPASALVINYFVLGATVSAVQLLGFAILWATIAALHGVPVAVVRASTASEAA